MKTGVAKSKPGPKPKKNKLAAAAEPSTVGESAEVNNQTKVELDSLGRLFIALVDASSSQDDTTRENPSSSVGFEASSSAGGLATNKAI